MCSKKPLILEATLAENIAFGEKEINTEALNNAMKYADAKNIFISVKKGETGIEMMVKDDGRGFEVSDINSKQMRGGNGLLNMKKRAETMKGELKIISMPGEGTVINLKFRA